MKSRLLCFVAFLLMSAAFPALASCIGNRNLRPADMVANEVHDLFEARRYAKLDELARDYAKGNQPTLDGQSALMAFYQGIGRDYNPCAKVSHTEDEWVAHGNAIRDWMAVARDPVAAKIALAMFTADHGWHARGSGLASSVSEQGWVLFRQRMASAKDQFDALAPVCRKNPAWHAGMLNVALAQGWAPAAFDALYRKAASIDPYYILIHYTSAAYHSPRWHGTDAQLREAIRQAVKLTRPRLGNTLYARLHWTMNDDDGMFTNGDTDWLEMKRGFEDWLRIHPDDYTRNHYARYACLAKDTATLSEQLAQLGTRVQPDAWKSEQNLAYCAALAKNAGSGKEPECFRRKDTGAIFCR